MKIVAWNMELTWRELGEVRVGAKYCTGPRNEPMKQSFEKMEEWQNDREIRSSYWKASSTEKATNYGQNPARMIGAMLSAM